MLGLAFSAAAQQIDTRVYRAGNDYEMKLDSVIGSDNFDFNRWKIVYSYQDSIVEETSYDWDHQTWVPATKTERNTISNNMKRYRWANEAWECFQMVTQEYVACGDESVLQCVTTTTLADSVWMATARDDYEYDNDCHLILNVSYSVGEGEVQNEDIQIGQLEIREPSEPDISKAEDNVELVLQNH